MKVELISRTQGLGTFKDVSIDELIVGQARVSTSRELNDLFKEPEKLLRHCITNQHWSIFELANLGFYVETSRDMGRELLRHGKQTGLTEFSQRYSSDIHFEKVEMRKQSKSNRQSSTEVINPILLHGVSSNTVDNLIFEHQKDTKKLYDSLIEIGAAKETARFILPGCTRTRLYFNFRIRELITFLNARLHKTAQKEIRLVAEQVRDIFIQECPIIAEALFKFDNAYEVPILDRIVLEKYKVYYERERKE